MLKRFFTPKWQHEDTEVRKQALVALDASNDTRPIETGCVIAAKKPITS